jgi:hypothetical protein
MAERLECQFGYGFYVLVGFEPVALAGCGRVAFVRVVQPVHGSPVTPGHQVPVDGQGERG